MSGKTIHHIEIINCIKCKTEEKYYVYAIKLLWTDGTKNVVYRRYSEFRKLHVELVKSYPHLFKFGTNFEEIMPKFPPKHPRKCRQIAESRLKPLNDYCKSLQTLEKYFSRDILVQTFFSPKESDLDDNEPSRNNSSKNMEISTPRKLQEWLCIEDFCPEGEYEVAVKKFEIVRVMEKFDSGWWRISTEDGSIGCVPASYLQLSQNNVVLPEAKWYECIKPYSASTDDELSLELNQEVLITKTNVTGWWLGWANGREGLIPKACIKEKTSNAADGNSFRKENFHLSVGLFKAIEDYAPVSDNCVKLNSGDIVCITAIYPDNCWMYGTKHLSRIPCDKKRCNKCGWIPAQFLIKVPDNSCSIASENGINGENISESTCESLDSHPVRGIFKL
ncbi:DgyrCDS2280 [Dimorphilus gyrociliatus]|uniref:DgyrCDS2280 n=2 Tax=Dimorphilus gyrociliatus TaxID=2664684 RepID=A0A7I8VBM1_9ANNE|nr:DgyrCDS2280 [Dimorphilus gyrociliatus]